MLSIIVPSRDRPDRVDGCLTSIRSAARPGDQLIVVDSASNDAAAYAAIAKKHNATLVRCDLPGVNRARNAGRRAATNELLAYCDDDVVVDPTWATAFADAAAKYPNAAFITGRISALATPQRSHGNVAVKDDPTPALLDRNTRNDMGHGASILVRTSALDAIGGWDEAMGVGGRFKSSPETDLYDRLFLAGFTGRYEPSVIAQHEQWRDQTALIRLDWRYGYGNGARIAKLMRRDRPRARQAASEAIWSWGLARIPAPLLDRNKTEVARVVARLVGTATGFSRAACAPVKDGHYVERERNNKS